MDTPQRMLDEISTRWPMIQDPAQFVLRYAPAIEGYLLALVRNPDQVDEIRQDFLLRVLQKGFGTPENVKGRFRNYLKVSIRNAAVSHLRRKTPQQADAAALAQLPGGDVVTGEKEWLEQWRGCVLERVWEALELHERQHTDNHAFTVLKVYVDFVDDDSEQLAARASERLKKSLGSAAFRKQLSRARRLFARLTVQEIVQTLEDPTPDRIQEELIDLGLLADIQRFLPDNWREELTP